MDNRIDVPDNLNTGDEWLAKQCSCGGSLYVLEPRGVRCSQMQKERGDPETRDGCGTFYPFLRFLPVRVVQFIGRKSDPKNCTCASDMASDSQLDEDGHLPDCRSR